MRIFGDHFCQIIRNCASLVNLSNLPNNSLLLYFLKFKFVGLLRLSNAWHSTFELFGKIILKAVHSILSNMLSDIIVTLFDTKRTYCFLAPKKERNIFYNLHDLKITIAITNGWTISGERIIVPILWK